MTAIHGDNRDTPSVVSRCPGSWTGDKGDNVPNVPNVPLRRNHPQLFRVLPGHRGMNGLRPPVGHK
jgi:hypothetical protein